MRTLIVLLLSISLFSFKTQSRSIKAFEKEPKDQSSNLNSNLIVTADAGHTWKDISIGLPENLTIDASFINGDEIYVGAEHGIIYQSNKNLEGTWSKVYIGIQPNDKVTNFFSGANGTYVCVYGRGFYRQSVGSKQWKAMHQTLNSVYVNAVLEKPDGSILVATNSGIYMSSDDCNTWKSVYTSGWVNNLNLSNNVIFSESEVGLILSEDGGENWHSILKNTPGTYISFMVKDKIIAYYKHSPVNFSQKPILYTNLSSDDFGNTWKNIPTFNLPYQTVNELFQRENIIYCSHGSGISISTNEGQNWELIKPAEFKKDFYKYNLSIFGKTILAAKVTNGC